MGPSKQHLSMLRSYTVADLFTLGNGTCGTISIFLCLDYIAEGRNQFFWIAFLLLFAALGCDILDGYWSRRSGRHSVLGADLDSLADVVSFGVAPAVLGFTLGLRGAWAALSDDSGKVKYFESTPIPTSILIVALLGAAFYQDAINVALWLGVYRLGPAALHPVTLIYGLSGSAMISATLRIPKP